MFDVNYAHVQHVVWCIIYGSVLVSHSRVKPQDVGIGRFPFLFFDAYEHGCYRAYVTLNRWFYSPAQNMLASSRCVSSLS
jgi:hypothetical protein